MAKVIQPSFAKGELAPSLHGRVDTAAYQVGLAKAKNVIIHPYGGVSNRAGLKYLAPVKDHTKPPRLIPFTFKASDQYILEMGDQYMRVIRDQGHVLETAVNITGATQANPVVITASSHGYSNGDEVYISGVGGMTEINQKRYVVANKTTNTFELTDQVTGNNIDGSGFSAYTSGGTVAKVYEISTPYAQADLLELKYEQSADTITLTHPDYAARDLTRTDHDSWTLSVIDFVPAQDHPTDLDITANTTGSSTPIYRVTALKEGTFDESLSALNTNTASITGATKANPVVITANSHGFSTGETVEINSVGGMTELNGRRYRVGATTTNTFELSGIDGTGYTTYTSGGEAAQDFFQVTNSASTSDNTLTWTAVSGAAKYAIYRDNGDQILGLIGETTDTTFTDLGLTADTSVTPPEYNDPLSLEDQYPGTSSYYQQRQVFGGSTDKPDTVYFSRVGDRTNLTAARPALPDDAFSTTLASRQVNAIRHFVPITDLVVLTSGSEWEINSGTDSAFEISTVRQNPQSFWGASHIKPIVIDNIIFFVNSSKKHVRSLGYSFQSDSYTGTNMSLLSNHYTQNDTIVDWAEQLNPEVRLLMCTDKGYVLAFTFDREQEVIAWSRWETNGEFERAGSLKFTSNDALDEVYFVVKRTINGNTVRYIELLNRDPCLCPYSAFFVDSGISYNEPVTVSNVTAADPVVVTANSHGFSNGDVVDFHSTTNGKIVWEPNVDDYFNETQPHQLVGRFKVNNVTTNTFEVQDTDGNDIDGSEWNAYVSGGKVRKAFATFTGLDHLEGETVVAVADGNVVRDLTVTDGAVTFDRKFSLVRIGLPYIADIETLNIESPKGTMQGSEKKVSEVTVRFEKSRGMLIGPSFSNLLVEMKQREFERLGEPTGLLTGDKKITLKPDWNTNGRIAIRQKDPLPLTVLAVVPDIEVSDV